MSCFLIPQFQSKQFRNLGEIDCRKILSPVSNSPRTLFRPHPRCRSKDFFSCCFLVVVMVMFLFKNSDKILQKLVIFGRWRTITTKLTFLFVPSLEISSPVQEHSVRKNAHQVGTPRIALQKPKAYGAAFISFFATYHKKHYSNRNYQLTMISKLLFW